MSHICLTQLRCIGMEVKIGMCTGMQFVLKGSADVASIPGTTQQYNLLLLKSMQCHLHYLEIRQLGLWATAECAQGREESTAG
eukprot:scaffold43829_cov12-Tisochrysis_lutea.AAC.1